MRSITSPSTGTRNLNSHNFRCAYHLELEFGPRLFHAGFPFPVLAAATLNALVHASELQGHAGTEFLQTGPDTLDALDFLPVRADHGLFGFALVAENVAMTAQEDVVTLVVQCQDLSALQVRVGGKEGAEQVRGQQAQRGGEVVEDQFRDVVRRAAVAGDGFAGVPVRYGEVERRADR